MNERPLSPAFYAGGNGIAGQWLTVLHPPYTLWHLCYVVIGACLAPELDLFRLALSLIAFFLAVGVAAHALDEVNGRPLKTSLSDASLRRAAVGALIGAVGVGIYGIGLAGPGLVPLIAAGVFLVVAYNLEWFSGCFHSDSWFAASWGSFPVLVSYYAQAETITVVALLGATAAFALSYAQRALSTPARDLRRRVVRVEGELELVTGEVQHLQRDGLLVPLERALKALTWAMVALAATLLAGRLV
ncbi:MAG: hypothetical protein M3454_05290 [Actinomycetota bacterium]|nr:hypothetical protein [Actinomycetota bacterium]